jgi:hypothetical protein
MLSVVASILQFAFQLKNKLGSVSYFIRSMIIIIDEQKQHYHQGAALKLHQEAPVTPRLLHIGREATGRGHVQ